MIEAALAESGGRVSGPGGAATKLGIPRPTLDAKIRRLESTNIGSKFNGRTDPGLPGNPPRLLTKQLLLKNEHRRRPLVASSQGISYGTVVAFLKNTLRLRRSLPLWVMPRVIVTNRGDLDHVASQYA